MSARERDPARRPAQLAQVSQALHPGGAGASVLATRARRRPDDPTRPRACSSTRPGGCTPTSAAFISDQIYDGRLDLAPDLRAPGHRLRHGTAVDRGRPRGLLDRVRRGGRLVAATIGGLIGSAVDRPAGAERPLGADDVMVVAPYNDQVDLAPSTRSTPTRRSRGVRVGTVDKFQGQEAPVVFFTMTTSTAADMPRRSRLPVLQEPAQRRDQPCPLPRLPHLHRRAARRPGPRRRGDEADRHALRVRRERRTGGPMRPAAPASGRQRGIEFDGWRHSPWRSSRSASVGLSPSKKSVTSTVSSPADLPAEVGGLRRETREGEVGTGAVRREGLD